MACIIDAIKTYDTLPSEFTPIRMTVMGMAESGKTVLIKTLITAVQKMFGFWRSALVSAPTGSAAYKSGGVTIHKLCAMNPHNANNNQISSKEKEKLVKEFMDIILLFVDGRGMTDLQTLGRAECAVANSTRDGKFSNKSWAIFLS